MASRCRRNASCLTRDSAAGSGRPTRPLATRTASDRCKSPTCKGWCAPGGYRKRTQAITKGSAAKMRSGIRLRRSTDNTLGSIWLISPRSIPKRLAIT